MKKRFLGPIVSGFLKAYFKLRYGSRVQIGKHVILSFGFHFRGPGRLIISDHCNLWTHEEPNRFYTYSPDAIIRIGEGTRLNGVTIQAKTSVSIGKNCLIGSAILMDQDFHSADPAHRSDPNYVKTVPISIEDEVWLAGQSAVLKGVTVGKGSVVAFRAVVTRSVPAHSLAAGNPAQVVKDLNSIQQNHRS